MKRKLTAKMKAHYEKMRGPGNPGYLASGFKGKRHTLEARERISLALSGRRRPPLTAEHKAAISAALKGKKRSPAQRARMGAKSRAVGARFYFCPHGQSLDRDCQDCAELAAIV